MAQILSQDEIDALMQGIATEKLEVTAKPQDQEVVGTMLDPQEEIKPYDFARGELMTRGRLPGLEIVFRKFARHLRTTFVSELSRSVDVSFDSLEVMHYEELIKRITLPASIHVLRLEPFPGTGAFVLEAPLAFTVVDLIFGGSGERMIKVEGRDFTPIETNFLGKFVNKMLLALEEVWKPMLHLKAHYVRAEINPYLLGATAMWEIMLVVTYNVGMEHVSGKLLFFLPYSAVKEMQTCLKGPFPVAEELGEEGLFAGAGSPLLESEVSLRAVVDVVELRLSEIVNLRPGDILKLNGRSMDWLELWVEGRPKFCGQAAQHSGAKVFVVSQRSDE
ncbi:MAG: flagellar motor switch protein FliM [Deltaproteobacteria bacterium]|nr:flagellar motor switch protein FliM [Deltaproteobacteria bacterium]